MITPNRVTIIVADGAVYTETAVYTDLDLSQCGIPENVHALQFLNGQGEIEWKGHRIPNEPITELPSWALNCLSKWEEAHQIFTQENPV